MDKVSAWVEKITIPTYAVGAPEKNPIFLERRIYQGSKGAVYPYPVVEKISDTISEWEYTAVFIENAYLRIMVLPELGGRVHRAFDKIRQRDFIYYNQVIKPALVGLTGPWISGGIEFNWPQHHRPSTFDPVDFSIEEFDDGSKTIWVNEIELMTRTKGMAGYTLYPGKAYLEVKGRIYNRTPFPQSFLWWANPAVKVNDHFQSVFPPDVYAVFDHGKRDVSAFPIAKGVYYKINYAPGTDISFYKNIPAPTSYMAIQSKYDFIGGYEHDIRAGMLYVANHHISPGKKQWTWGNGDFGLAWNRNLTDNDGPYIELMCGVFTDNQPDFTWIQPNEQKSFEQYFLPYARIGLVKNATKSAAVNLEINHAMVYTGVFVTSEYPGSLIRLTAGDKIIFEEYANLSPENVFEKSLETNPAHAAGELLVEVFDNYGALLVKYQAETGETRSIPPAAVAADRPEDIRSNELLYLNGLHLEQYRHGSFSPVDYYLEALKRDDGDIRCNTAMGLWLARRAMNEKAEVFFRKAIDRITVRNPNPYNGDAHYFLGLCLKMMGKMDEAYEALYKSVWCDATQHSAYFQLALIAIHKNNFSDALSLIDQSLKKNNQSHSARHLKASILRHLGYFTEAMDWIADSLAIDPFNYGCRFEEQLLLKITNDDEKSNLALSELKVLMRNEFNNYAESFFDYWHAGLHREAVALMSEFQKDNEKRDVNPLMYYYLGAIHIPLKEHELALKYFRLGASAKPDFCFPGKVEDVYILQTAIRHNAADSKAHYYLGNFWYANAQFEEAISSWEKSITLNDQFPTAHRNISLALYNKAKNVPRAMEELETAFRLDDKDARVLMELDQLYKLQNVAPDVRLKFLEAHKDLVESRDDLYLERITLYNQRGDYKTASRLMAERTFHPWEGGEGKTVIQFLISQTELAKKAIGDKQYDLALERLSVTDTYPLNLGEGKLPGIQENDIQFLKGIALEAIGSANEAKHFFHLATNGISEPAQAIFYNDPQPDKIFYQGLAWIKLGNKAMAANIFERLISFADEHINDIITIDYFAVSLPDLQVFDQDLNARNQIHCLYIRGLGLLGLGKYKEAEVVFDQALSRNINHQGAYVHAQMTGFLKAVL